jgi:tRNA(Ile)-lysidine synthase
VRCYDGRLYLAGPPPEFDTGLRLDWNINEPLELPGGTLAAFATTGGGLRIDAATELEVRFRQGGETLQPAGRHEHHALKKLFQEWRVPPWERATIPLVFAGGDLVAVAGLCICEGYRAGAGERGYELCWSRNPDSTAVAL